MVQIFTTQAEARVAVSPSDCMTTSRGRVYGKSVSQTSLFQIVYEILLVGVALYVAVYLLHLWDEGHLETHYIIILSGLQARLLLSKIPMGKFLSKNYNSLINIRFICIISYKISSYCYVY